ncbi:MAG TPA: septal ring lytic transglycosylase RlpA family protein [Terracidiphilus sp.]|jgi:rare lipoprotein A
MSGFAPRANVRTFPIGPAAPAMAALALTALLLSGCSHHHRTASRAPQTAPPLEETYPAPVPAPPPAPSANASNLPPGRIPPTPLPPGGITRDDIRYVNTHPPILTEVGLATWYSAPYKGRKAANGEVFDDAAFTAAHRTLPMGSLVVVTNLATGQWAAMRISDRGPFVEGRIVDLTVASAKATGVYRAGVVKVRLDVYQTPKPIDTGGRWCVQVGAFHSERQAVRLKSQLLAKYPDASVIEFPGQESSYWVRIRPQGDNRGAAELIARQLRPSEGEAFLTRLD